MPDITQNQVNMWDLTGDRQLTQADVDFAIQIGMHSIAGTIQSILDTGTGTLNVQQAGSEMSSPEYQSYLADPQAMISHFQEFDTEYDLNALNHIFDAFQSGTAAYTAPAASKRVLDWSAFWADSNIPTIGYDGLDDKLVILKGAYNSADSSKDILVYDFITGTWTKGDTKIAGTDDMTNMITAPDTSELVIMHQNTGTGNHIKRFKAHQVATGSSIAAASQTVNIVTPFFDFGSSGQQKRLYKVTVLAHGTNLDNLAITASYDGNTGGYSNIFVSNVFANTTAHDWGTILFTVSSPTDFYNISVKIAATGAMTTAVWGISEISFIYREKGIR